MKNPVGNIEIRLNTFPDEYYKVNKEPEPAVEAEGTYIHFENNTFQKWPSRQLKLLNPQSDSGQ